MPSAPFSDEHSRQQQELQASYFHPHMTGPAPLAPRWTNRDLQLQAYISSLPLATPLKGSPTATPGSSKVYATGPAGPSRHQTETTILATMQNLYSTPSSGACTPSQPQHSAAGFANHAQLLRAKLSPLVTGESLGLSRAMERPAASSVPGTAFSTGNIEAKPSATKLPFMGHVRIC